MRKQFDSGEKKAKLKITSIQRKRTRMSNSTATTSEANRQDLKNWYVEAGYQDVKFWVPPNVLASQEECVAEVLAAVKKFGEDTTKENINKATKL